MNVFRTQITAAVIAMLALTTSFANAQTSRFFTNVEAKGYGENATEACQKAFVIAQTNAFKQIDDSIFDLNTNRTFSSRLIDKVETQHRQSNSSTVCNVNATWESEIGSPISKLSIGSEQIIQGAYDSICKPTQENICWQKIIQQAREDLEQRLQKKYSGVNDIALIYVDFNGSQINTSRQESLEIDTDGQFYFEVVQKPISTQSPPRPHQTSNQKAFPHRETAVKPIDITLSYVWDNNNQADRNDLSISSGRLGLGIWTHNALGVVAFTGSDKFGLGDEFSQVHTSGNSYRTLGLGVGYRLWQSNKFTIENMLYYVDAEPITQIITPNCSGCSSLTVSSKDYLQATINLKTNTQGLNAGWMFTWKFLDQENIDNLSSGLYLELQF